MVSLLPTMRTSVPSRNVSSGVSGISLSLRTTRVTMQCRPSSSLQSAMFWPIRLGCVTRTKREMMLASCLECMALASLFRSKCSRRGRSWTKRTTPTTPNG